MSNNKIIDKSSLLQEESIMSYLQGKMTKDEEKRFLDELDQNSEYKAKAISIARLVKGLEQVGTESDKILKEALLAVDETAIKEITRQTTKKSVVSMFKRKHAAILSVAASLLIVAFLGLQYYDNINTTSLGDQYAVLYDESVMRGDNQSPIEDEIHMLIDDVYYDKDLDKTLKRLAIIWEVSTMDTYNDYTIYAPEVGWALATGYLKDNNREDAKSVLNKMSNLYDANSDMGKKVRELLEKIK